jgi:hypothetical protein
LLQRSSHKYQATSASGDVQMRSGNL